MNPGRSPDGIVPGLDRAPVSRFWVRHRGQTFLIACMSGRSQRFVLCPAGSRVAGLWPIPSLLRVAKHLGLGVGISWFGERAVRVLRLRGQRLKPGSRCRVAGAVEFVKHRRAEAPRIKPEVGKHAVEVLAVQHVQRDKRPPTGADPPHPGHVPGPPGIGERLGAKFEAYSPAKRRTAPATPVRRSTTVPNASNNTALTVWAVDTGVNATVAASHHQVRPQLSRPSRRLIARASKDSGCSPCKPPRWPRSSDDIVSRLPLGHHGMANVSPVSVAVTPSAACADDSRRLAG
jgi:hypothetical protein